MHITPRTIYRYIDNIREAGFVVNKLYGNVYAMGKVGRGLSDFNKLIYFTEEEAYITSKFIEGIDNNNVLKRNLQRKLASVYNITSIGNYVGNAACAENVKASAYYRLLAFLPSRPILQTPKDILRTLSGFGLCKYRKTTRLFRQLSE